MYFVKVEWESSCIPTGYVGPFSSYDDALEWRERFFERSQELPLLKRVSLQLITDPDTYLYSPTARGHSEEYT